MSILQLLSFKTHLSSDMLLVGVSLVSLHQSSTREMGLVESVRHRWNTGEFNNAHGAIHRWI